jgi:hypothetical protein
LALEQAARGDFFYTAILNNMVELTLGLGKLDEALKLYPKRSRFES